MELQKGAIKQVAKETYQPDPSKAEVQESLMERRWKTWAIPASENERGKEAQRLKWLLEVSVKGPVQCATGQRGE